MTPDELLEDELLRRAREHREAAEESFQRCDTDGFISQWAHGICAQKAAAEAELVREGGVCEFEALFDLNGDLVPAKLVDGKWGLVWMLLDSQGRKQGWFNPSTARKEATRRRNNALKGFYVGRIRTRARIVTVGSGTGMSGALTVHVIRVPVEGADMEILDNGKEGKT